MTARVDFIEGETNRYRSLLHRPDGVDVEFEGVSYNKLGAGSGGVPHDIAHLIVEDAGGTLTLRWDHPIDRALAPGRRGAR